MKMKLLLNAVDGLAYTFTYHGYASTTFLKIIQIKKKSIYNNKLYDQEEIQMIPWFRI